MPAPLLSIIIPVYNVESYIKECLDSVLQQTFQDYEVILIDDGSTDSSGMICDQYAANDRRFKIIHKANGGVSAARNDALEICTGKYLTMLDSDDTLSPDAYENVHYMEQHPEIDILQYPYINCYPDGKQTVSWQKPLTIQGKEQLLYHWWEGNILDFSNWDKIFKREIFNNLRYRVGHIFEDAYLTADLVEKANVAYISEKGRYFYKVRGNSLSANNNFNKLIDLFEAHFRTYLAMLKFPSLKSKRVTAFNRLFRKLIQAQISSPEANIRPYLKNIKPYVPSWADVFANHNLSSGIWISAVKILGLSLFTRLFCQYLNLKHRSHA